ncbi:MAG: hypothetical protein AB7O24_04445 [Kofleriaceae bacterium]
MDRNKEVTSTVGGVQFAVKLGDHEPDYLVAGVRVGREDYLAILQSKQAEALDIISGSLSVDTEHGVANDLAELAEQFDPAVDESFAQKLLARLER